jgi:hypothetical protein
MLRHAWIAMVIGCGASPKAPPTKATAVAIEGTPCFAGQPALNAEVVYTELQKHSASWSVALAEDQWPPPRSYGTCTVHRGKVVAADGTLVAEVSCNLRIVVNGIYDELGLQVGAHGRDVIAKSRADTNLHCVANGPGQARCNFPPPPASEQSPTSYVVAGELHDETMLVGKDAAAFFADRKIVEIAYSVNCH